MPLCREGYQIFVSSRKQGLIAWTSTRPRADKMRAFGLLCFSLQLLPQPPTHSKSNLLTLQSTPSLQYCSCSSHPSYVRPSQPQQTFHNQSCHITAPQTGTPPVPTTTSTWNKASDTVVLTGNYTHTTAGPSTSPPPESTDTL